MTETTIWDIEEHRSEPIGIRDLSFRESYLHLDSYLDGDGILEPRSFASDAAGNPLMARAAGGIYVSVSLTALQYGSDSPLLDCEIRSIRDEDGRLHITGARNGDAVDVEVRQLTGEGMDRLSRLTESVDYGWISPVNRAYFKEDVDLYDGVLALWNDRAMAAAPEYAAHSTYLPKVRAGMEHMKAAGEDGSSPERESASACVDPNDRTITVGSVPVDPASPLNLSMGDAGVSGVTL